MNINKFLAKIEFVNFHLKKQFQVSEIEQIRLVKIVKKSKLKFINKFSILFLSNDWIDFNDKGLIENYVSFYAVKLNGNSKILIIGILFEYFENGIKSEKLVYENEINRLTYFLLQSKYDEVLSQ